ncbi:PH domain-containing protein [Haloarcula sediminis]|uniref:PH domain-containing protein n=1 Tax=Haloarcula sediminis TaxID=3111777 RepID=UPI002D76E51F|nr:PH domain-containing protein [Haloarcula sp. CK38]
MSVPDWAPAGADETVRWEGQPRRRVVHLGVAAGVAAALVVLGGAGLAASSGALSPTVATVVGVALAALALAVPAGGAWLWRWSTRYVLTDAALYHRTGVLSLTVTELRLAKIQNTSYDQGVFGAAFGHGTVTVDTAGSRGAELTLRQLDGPAAVHQRIAESAGQAAGDRADDIPGSLDAWRAVRTEVRRIRAAVAGDR